MRAAVARVRGRFETGAVICRNFLVRTAVRPTMAVPSSVPKTVAVGIRRRYAGPMAADVEPAGRVSYGTPSTSNPLKRQSLQRIAGVVLWRRLIGEHFIEA